jgi:hypothetical protein
MPTRLSTLGHLAGQIAHLVIILPTGTKQHLICHIRSLLPVKAEMGLITAGLPAASAILPLYFSRHVQLATTGILVVMAAVMAVVMADFGW